MSKEPHIAQKYLTEITQPRETDLTLIPLYYNSLGSPDKRTFIAFILLKYSPGAFKYDCLIERGVNSALSKTLHQKHPLTHRLIKEAIAHYRVYPHFKEKVDSLLLKEAA